MVRQKGLENGEVSNGVVKALPEPAEQQTSEEEEGKQEKRESLLVA